MGVKLDNHCYQPGLWRPGQELTRCIFDHESFSPFANWWQDFKWTLPIVTVSSFICPATGQHLFCIASKRSKRLTERFSELNVCRGKGNSRKNGFSMLAHPGLTRVWWPCQRAVGTEVMCQAVNLLVQIWPLSPTWAQRSDMCWFELVGQGQTKLWQL